MKELLCLIRSAGLSLLILVITQSAYSQEEPQTQLQPQTQTQTQTPTPRPALPQIDLTTVPIREQMNSIEARTRIYDNFRAVREDMFQKLKKNVNDTISVLQKRIASLTGQTVTLQSSIDSLNANLKATKTNLDDMTRSKNSISVLGMEVEKGAYNSVMWSVITVLLVLLIIGFLVFRRNQRVVINKNKDLEELKAEFESYRKTSREAREKMTLQHFNELKRLRGE